jgi:2-polyprenyl-3-methyl-5-hydroxy-6-metoxy-1,4-benzoquinol methylase
VRITPDQTVVDHRPCVACGGERVRELHGYQFDHLVRCLQCGLTFASRRPSDVELDAHYRAYGDWPDSEITRLRYREVLSGFEKHRSCGRLLDVGCGAGYFLEEAADAGWEPHGSTVGALSIDMCRAKGLHVVGADEAWAAFPADHFDAATAFEVVEHLRDPTLEAALLARVLRPGGLLYCTTPNFDSLSRRLLGPQWRVIEYPEHLVYFTAATLVSWLERFGFRLMKLEVTGISPGELQHALRQRVKIAVPRAGVALLANRVVASRDLDERLRGATEAGALMPAAKQLLNAALTRTRLGDTLKAWFVRLPD